MTPWLDDGDVRLYHGDVREVLAELPDASVDCVVTSPPYWGLRNYGIAGQLGLEPTPDEYVANMVAVFQEVRRVLADHGTCWVNMGTSYASGQSPQPRRAPAYGSGGKAPQDSQATGSAYPDLCDECRDATQTHRDRTAGSTRPPELDAPLSETTGRDSGPAGSGQAASGGEPRGVQASTNPQSSGPPPGGCSHCANCGACLAVLRSSTRDARLCVRMEPNTNGTPSTSPSSADRTSDTEPSALAYLYSTIAARRLKTKDDVLMPQILGLALQLDGWYVRSEIIWAKKNCMPESVTDRPTKSHETIWLLTKQPRYWFDAEAVREPLQPASMERGKYGHTSFGKGQREASPADNRNGRQIAAIADLQNSAGRNVRSVWQIATQPYPEAHFATFPEELARRCILAGCPIRVCRVCGKPSERIVEVGESSWQRRREDGDPVRYGLGGNAAPLKRTLSDPADRAAGGFGVPAERRSLGWSSCLCPAFENDAAVLANEKILPDDRGFNPAEFASGPSPSKWRPGLVLDPFAGSGTTLKVARDHGRHSIGIDLNEEYLELAGRRAMKRSKIMLPKDLAPAPDGTLNLLAT